MWKTDVLQPLSSSSLLGLLIPIKLLVLGLLVQVALVLLLAIFLTPLSNDTGRTLVAWE